MHAGARVTVLLAAAMGFAAPATAQQTISKAEVREQEPAVTDARLRDQLWGLFRKEDRRRATPPTQPLRSEAFVTRPYPVAVFDTHGLCRKDFLMMSLAPARTSWRDANADTPMRAYGVESSAHFRVLALSPEERGAAFEDIWKGPCSRIGDRDPGFFQAGDAVVAMEGYKLLMRAAAAVKVGELVPRCDIGLCSEALTAFAARPFYEIRDCTAEEKTTCYKLVSDEDVEVKIWQSAGGPLAARLTHLIVLRHPRPD